MAPSAEEAEQEGDAVRSLTYDDRMPAQLLARVRTAKTRVLPGEPVQPYRAMPGSPGIVLAYNEPPKWLCDYAIITDSISDYGLDQAVKHCLGLIDHPLGVKLLDLLNQELGPGVVEITEQVAAEEAAALEQQLEEIARGN